MNKINEKNTISPKIIEGLNEKQKEMVIGILEYVKTNDKNKPYYLVQGGGGVGKSYAIGRALHALHGYSIIAAAPSHFAKNILKQFLADHTEVKVLTVAALMGKKLTFNSKGEMILVNKPSRIRPPITFSNIVIIDEISMINDETVLELLQMCQNKKIIFLGDYCQLPPVGQHNDNIAFKNISTELIEPMRFTGYIYDLANDVRKEINEARAGKYAEIKIITLSSKRISKIDVTGSGYIFLNKFTPFIMAAIKRFKENKGTKYVRVLAYRNTTINKLNNIIRKSLYGDNAKQFEKGELIINEGGYKQDINNGEVLIVKKTKKTIGKFDIPCVRLYFKDSHISVPVVSSEGLELYNKQLNNLKNAAKKEPRKWEEFYAFKDSFAYFNYSYATSIHKSQGSTIANIFIMEDDILGIKPIGIKEKLQSLYVAITRTSFRLFIYNKELNVDQSLLIKKHLLLQPKIEEQASEVKLELLEDSSFLNIDV